MKKIWKELPFDKCPGCGGSLESLTDEDSIDQEIRYGDSVRCIDCENSGEITDYDGENYEIEWDNEPELTI